MCKCASYSYCARSWRQQTNPLRKKKFPLGWKCYKTIGAYVSYVFIEIYMKHAGSLESTREVRVAWGYALSNSYTSFVLFKLPACFIYISMNTHWRMNQLLSVERHCGRKVFFPYIHTYIHTYILYLISRLCERQPKGWCGPTILNIKNYIYIKIAKKIIKIKNYKNFIKIYNFL